MHPRPAPRHPGSCAFDARRFVLVIAMGDERSLSIRRLVIFSGAIQAG